jgi:hypothetical protein
MGWLFWVLNGGLSVAFGTRVLGEMVYRLIFALVLGMFGGGLFVLRHSILRLVLWIRRSGPLNYVHFLDYAVNLLFLRKVGGGYIFVHPILLEYFASSPDPAKPDQGLAVERTPSDNSSVGGRH